MLRPINEIIRNNVGNIIHRGFVVTGEVEVDNGDGSYDVFIAGEAKAYPRIFTLARNPDLKVENTVRILYKNGCKELPIILPPIAPTAITGEWVLPTGHIDLGGSRGWWNETRMYDGSLLESSNYNVGGRTWSNFIRLTHASMRCNKIRLYITYYLGRNDIVDIDAYYDGAWHNVFEGDYEHECTEFGNPLEWWEASIPEGIKEITEFRIRVFNSSYTNYGCGIFEVEFFKVD